MVGYNAATLILLRKLGPRADAVFKELQPSLVNDLCYSTPKLVFNMALSLRRRETEQEAVVSSGAELDKLYLPRFVHPSAKRWAQWDTLPQQIPSILLFLQVPKNADPSSWHRTAAVITRCVYFQSVAYKRSALVLAFFQTLMKSFLPDPYTSAVTMHLALVVGVLGVSGVGQISKDRPMLDLLDERSGKMSKWAQKEHEAMVEAVAMLPRWLKTFFVFSQSNPTITDIIDEIARRLPPEGEGLPGDYLQTLVEVEDIVAGNEDFSKAVRHLYSTSTASAVRREELVLLVSKLIMSSNKMDKSNIVWQVMQQRELLGNAIAVKLEPFYSEFARKAIGGALRNLSLLRRTRDVISGRPLSFYELTFILTVATAARHSWASTATKALETAMQVMEEQRRDNVAKRNVADDAVSLLEHLCARERVLLLRHFAISLYQLRFEPEVFYVLAGCTAPLLHEYVREVRHLKNSPLVMLDRRLFFREFLHTLSLFSGDELRSDSEADDADNSGEPLVVSSRTQAVVNNVQKCALMMLDIAEHNMDSLASSFSSKDSLQTAAPVEEKRGHGFAKGKLDLGLPHRNTEDGMAERRLYINLVSSALQYHRRRRKKLPKGTSVDAEATQQAIDLLHRAQNLLQWRVEKMISSTGQSTERLTASASSMIADSVTKRTLAASREEIQTADELQLFCIVMLRLIFALIENDTLNAADLEKLRGVIVEVIGRITALVKWMSEGKCLLYKMPRTLHVLRNLLTRYTDLLFPKEASEDKETTPATLALRVAVRKLVTVCFTEVKYSTASLRPMRHAVNPTAAQMQSFQDIIAFADILDASVALARQVGMTVEELIHPTEVFTRAFEMLSKAAKIPIQTPPAEKAQHAAEQVSRSMVFERISPLLHHLCVLSIFEDSCLAAATAALIAASSEERVRWTSWDKRITFLNISGYVFRNLAEHFAVSRHCRDLAERLLVVVGLMASGRLSFTHNSDVSGHHTRLYTTEEVFMAHKKAAIVMWNFTCTVSRSAFSVMPVDKHLAVILLYVKRHLSARAPSSFLQQVDSAEESCMDNNERIFCQGKGSPEYFLSWKPPKSREEELLQRNGVLSVLLRDSSIITRTLLIEIKGPQHKLLFNRLLAHVEVMNDLLQHDQQWIAPSVWFAAWHGYRGLSTLARVNRVASPRLRDTSRMIMERLLRYSQRHGNEGTLRVLPSAKVEYPAEGDTEAVEMVAATAPARQLLDLFNVSAMFALQAIITDAECRLYLVQLTDRLSEEQEKISRQRGASVAHVRPASRKGRWFADAKESEEQRQLRQLSIARSTLLYSFRRLRS